MAVVIREADEELGAEEKLVALKILLVIYLHDKRYLDALEDIEELLNDSKMDQDRRYLLLKQEEVRRALAEAINKRKPSLLQFVFNLFHDSAQ